MDAELRRSLNLRVRISGVLLLLLAGGFALLALVSARLVEHDMIKLLSAQQLASTSYIAGDIEEAVKSRLEVLQANAAQMTPARLADRTQLQHVLQDESGELRMLFRGGVLLLSPQGRLLLDWPSLPGRQQIDFSQERFFQEALSSRGAITGGPMRLPGSGEPGVPFAVSLRDAQGAVTAVLVGLAGFSDDSFFGVLQRTRFGDSGYALVEVPKYGLIASSSKPDLVLRAMSPRGENLMRDRIVDGFDGAGVTINSSGVETLLSGKRIPSAEWVLLIVLPTEEAFAPIRKLQRLGYLVSAGFCGLVFFLAWRLLGRALRPLESASLAIEDMVSGKSSLHGLPIQRGDEIGRLLHSFNRLVAERQKFEDELRRSQKIFEAVGMSITESIFLLDPDCRIHLANQTAAQRLGYTREALLGRDFSTLFGDGQHEVRRAVVQEVCRSRLPYTREVPVGARMFASTYYPVLSDEGEGMAVVVVVADITERKEAEAALIRLAQTDALTGLANRARFMQLAELELSRMARYGGRISVLMMDVDHFKSINDSHGHKAGDMVLQSLGRLCRDSLREVDVAGRLGGEEFAILLPQTELAQALEVAERLRSQVAATAIPLDSGFLLPVTMSIGVAMQSSASGSVDALLHQADLALYQAKRGGRNRVCAAP